MIGVVERGRWDRRCWTLDDPHCPLDHELTRGDVGHGDECRSARLGRSATERQHQAERQQEPGEDPSGNSSTPRLTATRREERGQVRREEIGHTPTLGSARRDGPGQELAVDDEPLLESPVDDDPEEDEELELVEPLEPVSFDPPVDEPVVLDDEPPVPEESPRESVR